jgi:hypothetical protein
VLPGTVIHGTLKFRGANADIQNGAKINNFDWDKTSSHERQWTFASYVWKFFRFVFTTIAYLLLAFLLLKLVPSFSENAARIMHEKPWAAGTWGFLAVISVIAAVIACIVLLILSFLISPAFGIVATLGSAGLYAVLFFVAAIPFSLWLGRLVLRGKSVVFSLGTGLVILNGVLFILKLMTAIPSAGPVFQSLSFLVKFGVIVFGSGAIVIVLKNRKHLSQERNQNTDTQQI